MCRTASLRTYGIAPSTSRSASVTGRRASPAPGRSARASTTSSKCSRPSRGDDLNPRRPTADRPHPGAQPQPVGEGRDEPLDVGPRAAGRRCATADGRGTAARRGWTRNSARKAAGKSPSCVRVSRPDGGDLRDQQAFDEPARVAPTVEELPERGARAVGPEQPARLAEEAGQVGDHPVKARVGEMRGPGEDAAGREDHSKPPAAVGDRERHLGRLAAPPRARPAGARSSGSCGR